MDESDNSFDKIYQHNKFFKTKFISIFFVCAIIGFFTSYYLIFQNSSKQHLPTISVLFFCAITIILFCFLSLLYILFSYVILGIYHCKILPEQNNNHKNTLLSHQVFCILDLLWYFPILDLYVPIRDYCCKLCKNICNCGVTMYLNGDCKIVVIYVVVFIMIAIMIIYFYFCYPVYNYHDNKTMISCKWN